MNQVFETTVDSHGHIPIPSDIRERHHLRHGTRVKIEERGDEVVITPSAPSERKTQSMSDLAGFLGSDPKALRTLMEERHRDREEEDRPFGT